MASSPKPWLVVRQKGKGLVHTVPGERYRTKKRAEKEASLFNRVCKGSGVKFMVRKGSVNLSSDLCSCKLSSDGSRFCEVCVTRCRKSGF